MKNLIFNCLLIFFGCLNSFSQPTISTAPATSLICPGALTDYSISYPSGYTSCSVAWSISTGTGFFFNGNQTSSNVKVTWDDQKPNKVTIQAVVTYFGSGGSCDSPETVTRTFTHTLRTVFGESITAAALPAVPYCTSSVNVVVDHLYIKNSGVGTQPPLAEVESYEWALPSGWRQTGTNNTGTIYTPINAIAIEPVSGSNCSIGGDIVVKGIAGSSSCTGFLVSKSLSKSISITRTPIFAISASGGYTGQHQCGQAASITFSVPDQSCASSYSWNFPSGWSGSSTSNSIVLTTGGGANVAGPITVSTSINNGLCTLASAPFTISFNNPSLSISSGSPVCTSGSAFALNNVPPGSSVSWQASPSSLFSSSSGSGTSAFLTALSSKSSGAGDITFYVSNPGCSLNTTVPSSLWVGKPSGVITNPSGVPAVEANIGNWVVFWATSPGATTSSLNWWTNNAAALNLNVGYGNCSVECLQAGYNFVYVTSSNACGTSLARQIPINVTSGGCQNPPCYPSIVSPNPSSSYFEVSLDLTSEEYTKGYDVKLYGSIERNLVYQATSNEPVIRIETLNIKKGMYILQITTSKQVITDRVLIE